ncbi:MAG: hypothetical protein ACP5FH_08145 [Terracidiphilus sp.]
MNSCLKNASASAPAQGSGTERASQKESRVYQVVTVAAILAILGSLWLF